MSTPEPVPAPLHHGRDMYRDVHIEGTDMLRWVCTEPGRTAIIADEQLAMVQDQAWASDHGMVAPGWQVFPS